MSVCADPSFALEATAPMAREEIWSPFTATDGFWPPISAGHSEAVVNPDLPVPSATPSAFLPDFFRFVKVVDINHLVRRFRNCVSARTPAYQTWPKPIPSDHCFLGRTDLGGVDFQGIKAGTVYDAEDDFGLLVK